MHLKIIGPIITNPCFDRRGAHLLMCFLVFQPMSFSWGGLNTENGASNPQGYPITAKPEPMERRGGHTADPFGELGE